MSVSRCVFRLEIADDRDSLSHIHYVAPKLDGIMSSKHNSQGVQCDGNIDTKHADSGEKVSRDLPVTQEKPKHRGRRQLHEITIETYTQTTDDQSTESNPPSQEPSPSNGDGTSSSDRWPKHQSTVINFFSGNPFVEVTKGILHLYKENQMTSLKDCIPRSEMLCILAVPATMSIHNLLQFTAPCSLYIEHMRIIRDSTPNQYMVLIKFRAQEMADEFYKAFNGIRFNNIEPEVCHLVYVAKVETTKESESGCMPLEGHTELPTCPVCLERMDESVDGILTILCNHSFHGCCLSKWGDISCPVCRYCQTPEVVADNRCLECHSLESLWICLICGHVGCGRYVEGHAYNHFQETQHTYAMQLGNNSVWDYAGDNYVHRLVQNKTDGKLVELSESRTTVEQDEKVDSIQLEYTYLLTSQLESQRAYFEERIARFEKDAHRQMEDLKERARQTIDECKILREQLASVHRDKQNQEKKIQQLSTKLTKTTKELKDEKEINKCLQQNQQEWLTKVRDLEKQMSEMKGSKDKEIHELQEQLRDIMFHLNAQELVQQAPAGTRQDIQEGNIVMGAAATATPSHKKKKN